MHRVILRAFVQPAGGQETCGGTGIYIDIPEGVSLEKAEHVIAERGAAELRRYLANECAQALSYRSATPNKGDEP